MDMSLLYLREENSISKCFFNKDIEMSYSLCLKSWYSKTEPYSRIYSSHPSFPKVFFLHYHENLKLKVVLRVRNCTHVAMSLDIQMSRLQ